jgi:leucyl/phenylalanyl-tRNA--protein transferase
MSTTSDDIVALGGNLEPETLRQAYRNGIFPWPADDLPLLWFCPRERAILELASLHVPRSLARARRRSELRFTVDAAFSDVIGACADMPRPGQDGTWITDEMVVAYERMHELGFAHSVEAWREDRLVGGIYGVDTDGAFSAESMFHCEPYASKLALLHLLDHLGARGAAWIDIQVMTPHMERLGARNVPRREFLDLLRRTRARGLVLFPPAVAPRAR